MQLGLAVMPVLCNPVIREQGANSQDGIRYQARGRFARKLPLLGFRDTSLFDSVTNSLAVDGRKETGRYKRIGSFVKKEQ